MTDDFTDAERATLLAALRFYERADQGEPFARSDEIHALATDRGRVASSLDRQGIRELYRKVQQRVRPAQAWPVPRDAQGWQRLQQCRGWSDAAW